MDDIQIVDSLQPYCFKIQYDLDFPRLLDSAHTLLARLGHSIESITEKLNNGRSGYQINLTHLPGLTGSDRWLKHNGNHLTVKSEGVNEIDFTERLEEMNGLYIDQVIRDVYNQHAGKFQGRASLLWLGANSRYNFHKDLHTPNRYHIPLITNEECYFLLRNENTYRLHLPVGNVWYLDPVGIEHTFVNNSQSPRLHLLLTSGY